MAEIGLFGQVIKKSKDSGTSYIKAMEFFKDTPKTEGAFYLRFQVMPLIYLGSLQSYYNTTDQCKIFMNILKYYNVKSK